MKSLLWAVVGVVALAVASAAAYWYGTQRPAVDTASPVAVEPADGFTVARLVEVRRQVASELLDPESAYFRDVEIRQLVHGQNHYGVCGLVSGKNSFGGYAEPHRFWAFNNQVTIVSNNDGDNRSRDEIKDSMSWLMYCRNTNEVILSNVIRPVDMNALSSD